MMKRWLIIILLLSVYTMSSCAFAPVYHEKTARTLGAGKNGFDFGFNSFLSPKVQAPFPFFVYHRGLTNWLDLAAGGEYQFVPVLFSHLKLRLINIGDVFAISAYGGGFFGLGAFNSYGAYGGPIASLKIGFLEPYVGTRWNHAVWRGGDLKNTNIKLDRFNFQYWQTAAGLNIWFSKVVSLNLNAQVIHRGWSERSRKEYGSYTKEKGVMPGIAIIINPGAK